MAVWIQHNEEYFGSSHNLYSQLKVSLGGDRGLFTHSQINVLLELIQLFVHQCQSCLSRNSIRQREVSGSSIYLFANKRAIGIDTSFCSSMSIVSV